MLLYFKFNRVAAPTAEIQSIYQISSLSYETAYWKTMLNKTWKKHPYALYNKFLDSFIKILSQIWNRPELRMGKGPVMPLVLENLDLCF